MEEDLTGKLEELDKVVLAKKQVELEKSKFEKKISKLEGDIKQQKEHFE